MTVPIIYYHSIANNDTNQWQHLSLSLNAFERQLKYLKNNGFQTLTISELVSYVLQGKPVPSKHIALTFDDGFLDNWVFAYPLLKKYNFSGTIFVNPDFIRDSEKPRPNLNDVWEKRADRNQLEWWGYASWPELQEMLNSGVMDIQSHGMTHNHYFKNNKLIDFHHPNDAYYWLNWLFNPNGKPDWLGKPHGINNRYGYPVYEHGPGICAPRYINDEALAEHLVEYVSHNGGKKFFKADWRHQLTKKATEYCSANQVNDELESQDAYLKRVNWELAHSKETIESQLGNKVVAMCWPNGGYTSESHNIAINDAKYKCSLSSTEFPEARLDGLWGRVSFRQDYQGKLKDIVHFLKFISIVESRAGTGIRNRLISGYQALKRVSRPSIKLTVGQHD